MISPEEAGARIDQAVADGRISDTSAANIWRWLTENPFALYRPRLLDEIEGRRWAELDDAFYRVLEFGTGGRRGKMYPVGTNVLNDRTMAESARGLADYVTARKGQDAPRSCVIARDTRHRSPEFAELRPGHGGRGFPRLPVSRPSLHPPALLRRPSSALRCRDHDHGIAQPALGQRLQVLLVHRRQVVPPDDSGIIACVRDASDREVPEKPLEDGLADGSIVWAGPELDAAYIASVVGESVSHARALSIVYTPLHGVGETSVAAALQSAGFTDLHILESQRTPDGNFPTVPGLVANPEYPRTLEAAIVEARGRGADLVIASDPDADRIGVAVPAAGDPRGEWTTLDGNQIGVLLAAFVMKEIGALGRLRPDHYLVTTLVSTQMTRALARREGVRVEDDLLVGFKWIASRIDEAGPAGFLFAFEESHGYLKGTDVRDKDASVAALLFAELAATVKDRKQTVLEYLDDLYIDVGHHGERLITRTCEGREGHALIESIMEAFRARPPRQVGGLTLTEVRDYQRHEVRPLATPGPASPLERPAGDLVIFHTERPGCRFAARPSGTEPKIKFYLFARSDVDGPDRLLAAKKETRRVLDLMESDLGQYIDDVLETRQQHLGG